MVVMNKQSWTSNKLGYTKMKQVLREGGNEITHILCCVVNGMGQYLTKRDHDKFLAMSEDDVSAYYSGDTDDEYLSMIDDIGDLVTGTLSLDVLKLRLLRNRLDDEVLEISGE